MELSVCHFTHEETGSNNRSHTREWGVRRLAQPLIRSASSSPLHNLSALPCTNDSSQ